MFDTLVECSVHDVLRSTDIDIEEFLYRLDLHWRSRGGVNHGVTTLHGLFYRTDCSDIALHDFRCV